MMYTVDVDELDLCLVLMTGFDYFLLEMKRIRFGGQVNEATIVNHTKFLSTYYRSR